VRSLFGYFFGLIASVAIFLLVLGALIWGRSLSIDEHKQQNENFFSPSKQHVASSLRTLDDLHHLGVNRAPSVRNLDLAIPLRIKMQSSLQSIDAHLVELARLAREFGHSEAFGLPARARRQLERLRHGIFGEYDALQPSEAAITSTLDALRDTLMQLERIYEVNHRDWLEQEREVVRSSTVRALAAGGVLVVLMALFVVGMANGLRLAMEREVRIRNDLEEAKENLETLALYDDLTGLGNRHQFTSRLEFVTKAEKRSGRCSALMYIDLDHFKRINDSFGHQVGDEVLKVVGGRLAENVRQGDMVARIGGDEFTVIAHDIDHAETAANIADKLLERIREPIVIAGQELNISVSIGITVLPDDGEDGETLMRNADMALYKAKHLGRNKFQ
jgi:diguanylate cyclase (GGDEF)-like protein